MPAIKKCIKKYEVEHGNDYSLGSSDIAKKICDNLSNPALNPLCKDIPASADYSLGTQFKSSYKSRPLKKTGTKVKPVQMVHDALEHPNPLDSGFGLDDVEILPTRGSQGYKGYKVQPRPSKRKPGRDYSRAFHGDQGHKGQTKPPKRKPGSDYSRGSQGDQGHKGQSRPPKGKPGSDYSRGFQGDQGHKGQSRPPKGTPGNDYSRGFQGDQGHKGQSRPPKGTPGNDYSRGFQGD